MRRETYRSPPFNLRGYKAFTVKYSDGSKATVLEHREVMEKLSGRSLHSSEFVHHKDGNKQNNVPENLEVITRSEHTKLHQQHRKKTMVELVCAHCGINFQREARREKERVKKNRGGPFCSKSCNGKVNH